MIRKSEWRKHIPNGGINDVIRDWHLHQPPRVQSVASPSSLTDCPRVIWLRKNGVPFTNEMGWGTKQRLLQGRVFENIIAGQLKDEGKLLWHWKDDNHGESDKFVMGTDMTRVEGTPDLLINLDGQVLISDAKTSRADSFYYVPIDDTVWEDELWYKYLLQVEAYYILCHKNKAWFDAHDLPLPVACHLFSFALDDGVVKREYTWTPTKEVYDEIVAYAKRWNTAYNAETIPNCECSETQTKFCQYAYKIETTKSGYKLGTECCAEGAV